MKRNEKDPLSSCGKSVSAKKTSKETIKVQVDEATENIFRELGDYISEEIMNTFQNIVADGFWRDFLNARISEIKPEISKNVNVEIRKTLEVEFSKLKTTYINKFNESIENSNKNHAALIDKLNKLKKSLNDRICRLELAEAELAVKIEEIMSGLKEIEKEVKWTITPHVANTNFRLEEIKSEI